MFQCVLIKQNGRSYSHFKPNTKLRTRTSVNVNHHTFEYLPPLPLSLLLPLFCIVLFFHNTFSLFQALSDIHTDSELSFEMRAPRFEKKNLKWGKRLISFSSLNILNYQPETTCWRGASLLASRRRSGIGPSRCAAWRCLLCNREKKLQFKGERERKRENRFARPANLAWDVFESHITN